MAVVWLPGLAVSRSSTASVFAGFFISLFFCFSGINIFQKKAYMYLYIILLTMVVMVVKVNAK